MQNQNSLKSIRELRDLKFNIPSYQRGYRWGQKEVEPFLEDIKDFSELQTDKDSFYCLQPLSLKKQKDTYSIIDGQQRLTTIFLIIKYLQQKELFTLSYQTRGKSSEFLQKIQEKSKEDAKDNIDFYHFWQTYEIIEEFFKENDKEKFLETLLNKCKFLWYEIDQKQNENEVFIRLNIGKIPLLPAENIKALFLAKNDKVDIDELKDRAEFWYETEKRIRSNRDFRYCVLNKVDPKDIQFIETMDGKEIPEIRDDILRIEAYLKAITSQNDLFEYFYKSYKDKTINGKWEELKECIDTLEGFASQGNGKVNREIFHYLGFLILSGIKISEIYKKWEEDKSQSEFCKKLFESIRTKVSQNIKNIDELNYTETKDRSTIKDILLLFNLEYLISQEESNEYFKFNRFVLEQWSLEHIYAQNSKSIKSKDKNMDEIKDWLGEILEYLSEDDKELKKDIERAIKDNKLFDNPDEKNKLFDKIDDNFKNTENLHKISNLTLLDKQSNSQIGNLIFSKKRKKIQELGEKDKLIPIATKKVFNKEFSQDKSNPDIFTTRDQEDYIQKIKEQLNKYLPIKGGENE